MLLAIAVTRTTRLKEDTALGIILSVFFGFGLMLLTFFQRLPDAGQAGLEQVSLRPGRDAAGGDVQIMASLAVRAGPAALLFWKEFKLLSFDRDFGASLGFPDEPAGCASRCCWWSRSCIGLQAVGVVLMSAMVVAPAAAARQWTDRLGVMVVLSRLFGAVAGVAGTAISSLARAAHRPRDRAVHQHHRRLLAALWPLPGPRVGVAAPAAQPPGVGDALA